MVLFVVYLVGYWFYLFCFGGDVILIGIVIRSYFNGVVRVGYNRYCFYYVLLEKIDKVVKSFFVKFMLVIFGVSWEVF